MLCGGMLLVVLACRPVGPPPVEVTAAPVVASAPVASAPVASPPVTGHPGTITFHDRDTGVTHVDDVATIPASIAWWEGGGRRVAVTRIETSQAAGRREIFRYGADGALLDVTSGR